MPRDIRHQIGRWGLLLIITAAVIIWLVSCEKPDDERQLKSVQSHDYYIESYINVPPHEIIMGNLIPHVIDSVWQYDSLYVTCLPFRNEDEPNYLTGCDTVVYTIAEIDSNATAMVLLYHFFSIKKQDGGYTSIIYDPQGDLIQTYMGQIY